MLLLRRRQRAASNRRKDMKILVFGATGGSGRAAVEELLAQGHAVSAFVRQAPADAGHPGLRYVQGDVMNPADVARAVAGHDAVIVTLGISENPISVRLFGPARTPSNVRSAGTRNVISAMQQHGVRRLVVQTSYGVGETRHRLRLIDRLFFALLLKPQIADTEIQNQEVSDCELDWLLVQPVHLTNGAENDLPLSSSTGETGVMKLSRRSVGRFLAHAVQNPALTRQTIALSGAAGTGAVQDRAVRETC
jgi:putative NADH-flavin reductase